MNTRDYLNVGLKLIGVIFFVFGLVVTAMTLLNVGIQTWHRAFPRDDVFLASESFDVTLMGAAQPMVYLVCGFILTRKTEWCLKLIQSPREGN